MSTGALLYGETAAREVSRRHGGSLADATAIQALVPASCADGMEVVKADDQTGWIYSAASTASAGNSVLVPADSRSAGRWLAKTPSAVIGAAQTANATGDASATPEVGVHYILRMAFAAGAGGSADDIIFYDATAPYKFRVLDCFAVITTGVAASTVTLRDAKAAGGNALSNAMASATSGATVRNAATAATRTIAAGGTLVLRRSDNGVAGEIIVMAVREA